VPVVASDIPPHQQLVGSDRGILFETGNLSSLIDRLDWAIRHPLDMQACRQRAQTHIQAHFRWDRITTQTLEVYNFLVRSPPVL
jgi:glycosyltransferase involved in cell wall biosynthesis